MIMAKTVVNFASTSSNALLLESQKSALLYLRRHETHLGCTTRKLPLECGTKHARTCPSSRLEAQTRFMQRAVVCPCWPWHESCRSDQLIVLIFGRTSGPIRVVHMIVLVMHHVMLCTPRSRMSVINTWASGYGYSINCGLHVNFPFWFWLPVINRRQATVLLQVYAYVCIVHSCACSDV